MGLGERLTRGAAFRVGLNRQQNNLAVEFGKRVLCDGKNECLDRTRSGRCAHF
jgi:hypothetical protein